MSFCKKNLEGHVLDGTYFQNTTNNNWHHTLNVMP